MTTPANVFLLVASLEILSEDYSEMLLWGIAFLFVIIGLFILNRVLRIAIGHRVRSRQREFGMTPEDLDKLRARGNLSEEEWARVRAAMGRRFLEQAKEEQEKRSLPAKAEIALQLAAAQAAGREPHAGSPPEPQGPAPATRPPLQRAPEPPAEPPDPLTPPLRALLDRPDFELEEMQRAGFLSAEDLALLRRAREQRP